MITHVYTYANILIEHTLVDEMSANYSTCTYIKYMAHVHVQIMDVTMHALILLLKSTHVHALQKNGWQIKINKMPFRKQYMTYLHCTDSRAIVHGYSSWVF